MPRFVPASEGVWLSRDFVKGAVAAAAASLVLHGLIPGVASPATKTSRGRSRITSVAGWQLPRHVESAELAALPAERARIRVNLKRPSKATARSKLKRPTKGNSLAAYRGLGSWIDIFNAWVWKHPWPTVKKMHRRGVETIYLQTATYGSANPVVHPKSVKQFLIAAHRNDMKVVGWYVPSFARPGRDLRMAREGLQFHTKAGHRFDSFALDIEATNVDNIHKRNVRLLEISRRLRGAAGDFYPLGAVIPDSHSMYWPNFPYRRIAAIYDVMVPMGYFTFRAEGFKHVQRYTEHNIRTIRKETGKKTPIHVIGGIADDVGVPAARGFTKAVRKKRVLGASLYDYPITSERTWEELSSEL